MLNDDEKKRIRAEEIFRHEMQREIKTELGRRAKWATVLSIMNSAFFLWFLSTVVIGALTFFYARSERLKEDERRQYDRQQTEWREKRLAEAKIDAEMTSRLNYFNAVFSKNRSELKESSRAFFALDKPLETAYPVNVFPEYGNRSMQSLLWEMLQIVPENEKSEIERAYKSAKEIPTIWVMSQNPDEVRKLFGNDPPRGFVIRMLTYLKNQEREGEFDLKSFNLERWGRPLTGFRLELDQIP